MIIYQKQSGFTLVELMMVVLIIGLLVMVASPFTSAWANSTELTRGEGVMVQAVGQAKATAQRNAPGVADALVASAVCIDNNNTVTVLEAVDSATSASCAVPSGNIVWTANLPARFAVAQGDGAAFNSLCYDNRGLVSAACAVANNALNLTVGGENASISFL